MDKMYNVFTTKYEKISMKLISPAAIITNDGEYRTDLAMWDTGANCTCISQKIVRELNLKSIGREDIHTPSGVDIQSKYLVDLFLPNNVRITNLTVFDSDIDNQGIDILIGMDVITKGDFAISNYDGKTVFTFRIPSIAVTDYIQELSDAVNKEMNNSSKQDTP